MEKLQLRSALKKLRQIPFDKHEHAHLMMAPQEMLDFLAMMAGIKPVYLLGRGFDDPQWIEGVTAISLQKALHVLEGPPWDAQPSTAGAPDWFEQHALAHQKTEKNVFYICRTRGTAEAVADTFDQPSISMDEEARLLGYPLCCVQDHYRRREQSERAFIAVLERTAGGDVEEMKSLVREDVGMAPETPEEIAALTEAAALSPAPFTSINMCNECAGDSLSPARKLSSQYEALVRQVDEQLAAEIAGNHIGAR